MLPLKQTPAGAGRRVHHWFDGYDRPLGAAAHHIGPRAAAPVGDEHVPPRWWSAASSRHPPKGRADGATASGRPPPPRSLQKPASYVRPCAAPRWLSKGHFDCEL